MSKFLTALVLIIGVVTAADGTRNAEIAAAIKTRVEAKKSAGMVVATIEADGSTSMAALGDPGPNAMPLDGDTVFEIGSITKVFTALLLADMADRGEVKLDEPVSRHLRAGAKVPERNGRVITLIDLSEQTSGLPRLPDNMKPANPMNPYADYTVEQMFEFLGRYQLPRDPGAEFEYSNFGVGLLGQALAMRAGKPYELLVKERILDPLGMDHTGVTLTPWMREHLAKGHSAGGMIMPNWDLPALAAAGALRSTMNDMLKFARANLDGSNRRIPRLLRQTHTIRRSVGKDMSIGMNWLTRSINGREVVWHNGGTGGYRTWIGFDKVRKIAAIVLTNSAIGHDDLGFELVAGSPAGGGVAFALQSIAPEAVMPDNKRELIDTGNDRRFVRRDDQGQFKESDDVGRASSQDRKTAAENESERGQGDRGDRDRDR